MHLGPVFGFHRPGASGVTPLPDIRTLMAGWLEATDAASYGGSGQVVSSLIAAPSDGTTAAANIAYLGSATGTDTADPVFTGTAGSQAAYFALSGTQEFLQLATTLGTGSIINNAHRSDNAGAFLFWAGVIPAGDSTPHALCGNINSSGQVGFSLTVGTNGALTFSQRAGGSTALGVSGLGVPRGVPVLIIASWQGNSASGNIRFWINSTVKSQYSGAFLTATTPTTRNMYLCAANGVQMMGSGTQMKSCGWGNSFIDDAQAAQIFALLQTKHSIDYTGGGPFSTSKHLMAAIGDSMTYFNEYNRGGTSGDMEANADGQYITYSALTNQRLRLPPANNLGVSGEQTTAAVARMAAAATGKLFDVIFVMEGTNDIGLNPVSTDADALAQVNTAVANLNAIYDYFALTLGKQVIGVTIPPRSSWGSFTAPQIAYGQQNIKAINAAILTQNGSRNGRLRVLDMYAVTNNGADAPLGFSSVDGLHFSPYGAMLYAQAFKTALAGIYGSAALPDFTTGNLLANGGMTGTGGAATGGTGTVADSYIGGVSGGTGVTPAYTASKPSSGIQQLAFSCPAGATSFAHMTLGQTITTGFAVGDTVYAQALVEVVAPTPVRINESALNLLLAGTGTSGLISVAGMGPWGTGNFIAETYIAPGQYLIQTPDMTIAAGTGLSLQWLYRMTGDTTGHLATAGTVQIKGAGIFKR